VISSPPDCNTNRCHKYTIANLKDHNWSGIPQNVLVKDKLLHAHSETCTGVRCTGLRVTPERRWWGRHRHVDSGRIRGDTRMVEPFRAGPASTLGRYDSGPTRTSWQGWDLLWHVDGCGATVTHGWWWGHYDMWMVVGPWRHVETFYDDLIPVVVVKLSFTNLLYKWRVQCMTKTYVVL